MSKIDISLLSPIRWLKVNYEPLPQYNMKHFEDDWAHNLIPQFYSIKRYAQKWQKNDIIYHQFQADYDPIRLEVWKCNGNPLTSQIANPVTTSISTTIFNVYQIDQALSSLAEGYYYFILKVGASNDPLYISELQDIREVHPNTRLFSYKHSSNRQSMIFENDFNPMFRCEASIEQFQPMSDDKVFIDQSRNANMVSSYPYRVYKLLMGCAEGFPDWVVDRMNRIFGCDSVKIDGKLYSKLENAKFEARREVLYPWAGWSLDIQESKNKSAIRFDTVDGVAQDEIMISFNYNTKGFGDYDGLAGDNVIQIIKLD